MLQSRTQTTTLNKVRTHANFDRNEQVDKLAKIGREKAYRNAKHAYEHAHATPYYFQKEWWHSMQDTSYKGPIQFLKEHLNKLGKLNNLKMIADQISNIEKWTSNVDIDNEL